MSRADSKIENRNCGLIPDNKRCFEIVILLQTQTTKILEHVNSRFRWGATMNQLGNVLARDRRFTKVGFDER